MKTEGRAGDATVRRGGEPRKAGRRARVAARRGPRPGREFPSRQSAEGTLFTLSIYIVLKREPRRCVTLKHTHTARKCE